MVAIPSSAGEQGLNQLKRNSGRHLPSRKTTEAGSRGLLATSYSAPALQRLSGAIFCCPKKIGLQNNTYVFEFGPVHRRFSGRISLGENPPSSNKLITGLRLPTIWRALWNKCLVENQALAGSKLDQKHWPLPLIPGSCGTCRYCSTSPASSREKYSRQDDRRKRSIRTNLISTASLKRPLSFHLR